MSLKSNYFLLMFPKITSKWNSHSKIKTTSSESAPKNSSITYLSTIISLLKSFKKNLRKLDFSPKRINLLSFPTVKILKMHQCGSKKTQLSLVMYLKSHKFLEIGRLDLYILLKNKLVQVKGPLINHQWQFKQIRF